jgi:hypothetical protein
MYASKATASCLQPKSPASRLAPSASSCLFPSPHAAHLHPPHPETISGACTRTRGALGPTALAKDPACTGCWECTALGMGGFLQEHRPVTGDWLSTPWPRASNWATACLCWALSLLLTDPEARKLKLRNLFGALTTADGSQVSKLELQSPREPPEIRRKPQEWEQSQAHMTCNHSL